MTKEEIIQAISDDKMMPFIQSEQLAGIVDFVIKNYNSSLPSNLDEAASKYESNISANYYQDSGYTDNDVIDAFKAGAKWDRSKMMGKAVSGRYMKADGKVYVESWLLDIDPDSVKAGDEVKLIVIPK